MTLIPLRRTVVVISAALLALGGTQASAGWLPWQGAGRLASGDETGHTRLAPPAAAPPWVRVRGPRPPVVPPPGTLGRTYRRLSTPLPFDEHPRTGMLKVCNVPDGCRVSVGRMDGYRAADGAWYFRTKRPLPPGVPHIVTVRFHCRDACCPPPGDCCLKRPCGDRVIRLIPDRMVYLRY